MIKTYTITIPLPFEQSFELISKSGDDIISWGKSNSDEKNGYIDWKQSFWSLTGNTLIMVKLKRVKEDETVATVTVHKPMQVIDPLGICKKVFNKLVRAMRTTIAGSDTYKDIVITIE